MVTALKSPRAIVPYAPCWGTPIGTGKPPKAAKWAPMTVFWYHKALQDDPIMEEAVSASLSNCYPDDSLEQSTPCWDGSEALEGISIKLTTTDRERLLDTMNQQCPPAEGFEWDWFWATGQKMWHTQNRKEKNPMSNSTVRYLKNDFWVLAIKPINFGQEYRTDLRAWGSISAGSDVSTSSELSVEMVEEIY